MSETPVRWGTLGCARVFERRMVPGFAAASNAQLLAVASRTREKAEATAKTHGIPRAYGSYDALLADPEIEAVFIPLPNDQHAAWILRALDAGKHVLCDKPMTLTFADAQAGAQRARSRGLRLMEGFMYRHHPQHAWAKKRLAAGAIGTPAHFHAVFAYPAARDPSNIRWNAAQGGGALLDVGVYGVNAARWLLESEPEAVYAAAVLDPETGVDTHTTCLLEFPGGRSAVVVGGFDQAFASRYEIVGRSGALVAERAFQVGEAGVRVRLRENNADEETVERFPHIDQYGREIERFSAGVRDPSLPLDPGEDGVAQARVVEALRRSLMEGRRVPLDEVG